MPANNYTPLIALTIKHDEHSVIDVCIDNQRLLDASQRLLKGKTLEQSTHLIPQLFTLCAQAQTIANQQVCEALTNTTVTSERSRQAQQRLAVEWLKEHSWQLFLMAKILGLDEQLSQPTLALRKQLQTFTPQDKPPIISSALDQHIVDKITLLIGVNAEELLQFDYDQWQQWLQKSAAPYAKLMRSLYVLFELRQSSDKVDIATANKQAEASREQSLDPSLQTRFKTIPTEVLAQFIPEHIKNNDEQGAVVRTAQLKLMKDINQHHGSGVISRYFAKIVEMAEIAMAKLPPLAFTERISPTSAITTVAASRGDLLHYLAISEDKISDYQMFAPTEINFSSTSPLVTDLYALAVDNTTKLKQQAELIVGSYDPCVDYQVEVIHA